MAYELQHSVPAYGGTSDERCDAVLCDPWCLTPVVSSQSRTLQATALGPIAVEASGIAEDGRTGRAPKRVKGQERPAQELGVEFVDPRVSGTSCRWPC